MGSKPEKLRNTPEDLPRSINERAQNLFETGQLLCSEAVLTVINRGLGGDLPDDVAVRLAAAFPQGIGDSGCTCGALAGGVLAIGLFLGRSRPGGRDSQGSMPAAKVLHNSFRNLYGSTCCRVLSKKVRKDPKAHVRQCAQFTGKTAELVAQIILDKYPELAQKADWKYLDTRDSKIASKLKLLFS